MIKLFSGEAAVPQILRIVTSTNEKFINKFEKKGEVYQPWMSVPTKMGASLLHVNEMYFQSRFLDVDSLRKVKVFIDKLNPKNDHIRSFENYNLRISILENDNIKKFNLKIVEAENALVKVMPFFRELIDTLVKFYIPMETTGNDHEFDYGMSVMWLKGVVFFEKKQMGTLEQRAENIAHEIAHQVIINYQLNDFLIDGDLNTKVYSGIRGVERPAIMSFHGAAALSYMLLVAKKYQNTSRIEELKSSLVKTLDSLNEISFTKVGRKIFEEMHEFL